MAPSTYALLEWDGPFNHGGPAGHPMWAHPERWLTILIASIAFFADLLQVVQVLFGH